MPGATAKIFIALLLGIAVGYLFPAFGVALRPLADAFLRLIKMIIAPLLFSTLVVGISASGDLKTTGRIGGKAMVYFQITTVVAFVISLVLVNVFRPGDGLTIPLGSAGGGAGEVAGFAERQRGAWDILLNAIPTSVIDAMARGDVLQLVVFSTLFGAAVAAIGVRGRPVVEVLDSTAQAMFALMRYVMALAPIGMFAAIAATIGGEGFAILFTLGKLVAVMYLGLALYVLVVVGGTAYAARVPFVAFVRVIREPFLIAFSTASSEAALPKSLEVMERFGVPKHIVGFVLPAGYSFNQDGSTLYMATATIFVAQLAAVPLSIGEQAAIVLLLLLSSNGVAGVPRAALVILTGTLTTFGLPLEGAALLLGIDHILDMGRTAVNVTGNCMATVPVARWEGVFDDGRMKAFAAEKRKAA
ncbi:MAG: cation:dicarboxylase symporter family transporter [Luteitalea sp.]|nr:cation:dicarboxylase symporter family transporter [Luteitalea sp.]